MKAFAFSLQTMLDSREALERVAAAKLAAKIKDLDAAKDRLKSLLSQMKAQISEIESLQGAKLAHHSVATHARYLERIRWHVVDQSQLAADIEAKVDELRDELRAVMRERKSLEKLKDTERQRWMDEFRRAEQKEMDEIAGVRFIHKRRVATNRIARDLGDRGLR